MSRKNTSARPFHLVTPVCENVLFLSFFSTVCPCYQIWSMMNFITSNSRKVTGLLEEMLDSSLYHHSTVPENYSSPKSLEVH